MVDPDTIPRQVLAFGIADVDNGFELEAHSHAKGQLMMTMRGALTCEAAGGLWIVPPQCAIWIPGDILHSVKASPSIEGYSLLVDPAMSSTLPEACCTVSVTPLLRELVIRCATFPILYPETGMETKLVSLLVDELGMAPLEKFHLPMPEDRRLRTMAEEMISSPSSRLTVGKWARRIGMSERTLHRLLQKETGLSFSRWRQQFQIVLSLQLLSKGETVQNVATELGYESPASFVTMFKKSLGSPPARYMIARQGGQRPGA
ncbi:MULTISPECIES: AraC family transcriptional regulator [unclassified Sphingomonas]|nr:MULTISPECIES: helix-turn-helix transcriptional regulator [unclassified Sphingomonas]